VLVVGRVARDGAPIDLTARSSMGSGRRPVTTTFAPSLANNRAVAAPIPVPPPLTIATLPSSRPIRASIEFGFSARRALPPVMFWV
jgi:hypothetical protein